MRFRKKIAKRTWKTISQKLEKNQNNETVKIEKTIGFSKYLLIVLALLNNKALFQCFVHYFLV